jgi:hypothetical protein
MKDHLELLINELKSSQMIIKILQEEIKLTSTSLMKHDNLTNNNSYLTSEKNNAWKEIRCTRVPAMKHKRHNHTDLSTMNTFPLLSDRYNPLCNDLVSYEPLVNTQEARMATPKHAGKHKTVRKKRVLNEKQHKVMVFSDSHARGCTTEVNHLLKNDFCKETVSNSHINDKLTTKPNPIFEAVIRKDYCKGHQIHSKQMTKK